LSPVFENLRVWYVIKRLSLGVFVIALASTVLLVSDGRARRGNQRGMGQNTSAPAKLFNVAILQHSSQLTLDETVEGVIAGLGGKGFVEGSNLVVKRFVAEGDMATAYAIARQITSGENDLVLTITTPSLQAVANVNKAGKTKHVFGLVADPYSAGVGINRENHLEHPPHLAGIGTMQPVDACFKLAREFFPGLKTIGVVWNPAEANSVAQLKLARSSAQELGITLVEVNADNSSGVLESAKAAVARGAQALWCGGDGTVLAAFASLVQAATQGKIPVFTVVPHSAERGSIFDLGADYKVVGRWTGELAGEILLGRDPAKIPIDNMLPELLFVNKLNLVGLKDPWKMPEGVAAKAAVFIDETGKHEKKASSVIINQPGR
jgi:putative ABC transport system substrate-binding protein